MTDATGHMDNAGVNELTGGLLRGFYSFRNPKTNKYELYKSGALDSPDTLVGQFDQYHELQSWLGANWALVLSSAPPSSGT
jgi:hypothetical protein